MKFFIAITLALLLWGCTDKPDDTVDWDNLNYHELACSGTKSTKPGCKTSDDDMMAIGRGKGK